MLMRRLYLPFQLPPSAGSDAFIVKVGAGFGSDLEPLLVLNKVGATVQARHCSASAKRHRKLFVHSPQPHADAFNCQCVVSISSGTQNRILSVLRYLLDFFTILWP